MEEKYNTPHQMFKKLIELFIDVAWRNDGHYSEDRDKLTDEQKKALTNHVAGDLEGLLRYPDIYRGGTPLEFLEAKDREQERLHAMSKQLMNESAG